MKYRFLINVCLVFNTTENTTATMTLTEDASTTTTIDFTAIEPMRFTTETTTSISPQETTSL